MTEAKQFHWQYVAEKSLIPKNEGRKIFWGERRIALFNLGTEFLAVDNKCPHKQGPLADGITSGAAVYCPLHNWKIDLKSGCAVAGGEGRVKSYPVRVEGEKIYLGFEISEKKIPMKEILAILRPSQWARTKQRLTEAGLLAFTQRRVYGRGKQKGFQYWSSKKKDGSPAGVLFLPKRLILLVLPEAQVSLAVNSLIEANQTGALGDGKIFVSPVEDVIQIRTGQNEGKIKEWEAAP